MWKILILILISFAISGCASYTEIYRDDNGLICRVESRGNQSIKVDVKNEIIESNNKLDFNLLDLNLSKINT